MTARSFKQGTLGNPAKFGKYLLLERIGVGGMAEVFRAKTFGAEGFERLVAIKRILPNLVEDEEFVKMFIDEAKIAVRLQHPNIVGIHDLGRAEGTLYIAMEFVPGRDLRAIYDFEAGRDGRTAIGLSCHIVMKMCEALHCAHFATGPRGEALQVIHRDVSPQNVLLSFDGEVKVADFGLAKARGRMVQTQAGVVKGKLAYMSPEQLRGDEIDHRVDVFGLGIVLFELLSGQRLFLGPTDMDTLRRVYEARVPPMQELNPEVHPDLEAIVRRALAKDREQRYATALDLHEELQAFVYQHGCYAGASALRSYLREAFPDAAPPPDADLPTFSSVPPEWARPRETHRPPALRREIPPPPTPIPESGEEIELESGLLVPMEPPPVPTVEERIEERDGPPTEKPIPPPAVIAQRVIATGAPPPPRPELPSVPAGLYDENATEHYPPPRVEPDFDTSPAPADLDLPTFNTVEWTDDDDETTQFNALEAPPAPPATGEEEPSWDESTTVGGDPKSSTGGR